MSNFNAHIINASGSMDSILDAIDSSFNKAKQRVSKELNIDNVDVIFIDAPRSVIPELGVSGYTPNAHLTYIHLDPSAEPSGDDIYATLIHEFHHIKRWRKPGYGTTLWDSLVTEGLACLYEEEVTGTKPIYTKNDAKHLHLLDKIDLLDDKYNHHQVFITGNDELPRWFGYYVGYEIAKEILKQQDLNAVTAANKKIEYDEKVVGALN